MKSKNKYTRTNHTLRFRDDRWEQAGRVAEKEGYNNRTQFFEAVVKDKSAKIRLK
jgi:hypothetical protein